MAKLKKKIKKRFNELGVDRPVSKQDISNVKQYGMGVINSTFGKKKNGGVPTNEPTTPTAGQAGQDALQTAQNTDASGIPTSLQSSQNAGSAMQEIVDMSSQQYQVQKVLQEALEAKKNTAPYDKKIARVRENLAKSQSISSMVDEGLTVDQALDLQAQTLARAQAKIGYITAKKEEEENSIQEILQSNADFWNARLATLGLRVDMEQAAAAAAGRGGGGGGGGSRGGSGSGDEDEDNTKRQEDFQSDAGYLVQQLDKGLISWGGAWNSLHAEYPEMSNDAINGTLGGSWNPETGENKGYATRTTATNSDSGSSISLPSSQ